MSSIIAGVDEAGRGALAGPIYAAAVILKPHNVIKGLTDSKKISPKQRALLFDLIICHAQCWAISKVEADKIDEINILQASLLAMKKAVAQLSVMPDLVEVDGNHAPDLSIPVKTVIGGDLCVPAISAASILAKVARDKEMLDVHERLSQYGFSRHKGYGTKDHLQALFLHGPSEQHRRSFAPVRAALIQAGHHQAGLT